MYETKESAAFFRTSCVVNVETQHVRRTLSLSALNVEGVGEMQAEKSMPRQTKVRRTSSWHFGEFENV